MTKHICQDSSCKGLFHCPNCKGVFDLYKSDVVGVTINGKDEVVCENCYAQLKGGNQNGNTNKRN